MNTPIARPKYLNLLRIKLPAGAITSIAHRISGVLLFVAIPLLTYLLDLSLRGPEQYARVLSLFDTPIIQLSAILIVWALVHHLLAGIRFLLLDLHLGLERPVARASAWLVNAGGAIAVVLYLRTLF